MKNLRLFTLLVSILLILSACQSAATQTPAESPVDQAPAVEYPAPVESENATQAPGQEMDAGSVYPGLTDGAVIEWVQLESLVANGEVARIVQGDSSNLTLTLKDGRTFSSAIPQPGYLEAFIEACGDACKEIEIVKE